MLRHPLPIRSGAEPDSELNRRTRRKLITRRTLEEAALQLFAEQGYETTTVTQIAERADVGKRTFHFHFPTKEDVLFVRGQSQPGMTAIMTNDSVTVLMCKSVLWMLEVGFGSPGPRTWSDRLLRLWVLACNHATQCKRLPGMDDANFAPTRKVLSNKIRY
jgi:hypothetical protein